MTVKISRMHRQQQDPKPDPPGDKANLLYRSAIARRTGILQGIDTTFKYHKRLCTM